MRRQPSPKTIAIATPAAERATLAIAAHSFWAAMAIAALWVLIGS